MHIKLEKGCNMAGKSVNLLLRRFYSIIKLLANLTRFYVQSIVNNKFVRIVISLTPLFHTLWEYTKSPAYTPDVWARKYVQRVFCFAGNDFERIDFGGLIAHTLWGNHKSKKVILGEKCRKITIKKDR